MAKITIVFPEIINASDPSIPMVFPVETHVWASELIVWEIFSRNADLYAVKLAFPAGSGFFGGSSGVARVDLTFHAYDSNVAKSYYGEGIITTVNPRTAKSDDKYSVIGVDKIGTDEKAWTFDPKIITDGP